MKQCEGEATHAPAASGAGAREPSRDVSICVLTFRRPDLLERCLASLAVQELGSARAAILVIDNDADGSARAVTEVWSRRSPIPIDYTIEPEQSISRARNRAVAVSTGDHVAFIDDDEAAEPQWAATLLRQCHALAVDGVLGPVLPEFEANPPRWLGASGLAHRESFSTGTPLVEIRYMRTGNVLFRREIVRGLDDPFDPRLGLSGGEDADFFGRMLAEGRTFAWVDEARVHEWVPVERQRLRYHLKRALIRGVTEADNHRLLSRGTAKSLVAIAVYVAAMPVLLVVRYPLFARCAVSCCDHVAKLLAQCGIRLARTRSF